MDNKIFTIYNYLYLTVKAKTHGKSKYFKAKANTHGKSKYMHLTLEEESLEPKVLAKDVGPGGKSSMAAFDE